jgi:hypothetical protein
MASLSKPQVERLIDKYSGRKITESLGNVTVRGEKWKEQGGSAMANSLSEYV